MHAVEFNSVAKEIANEIIVGAGDVESIILRILNDRLSNVICMQIQIDDWIFIPKSMKAIRVPVYGAAYNAIADITFTAEKTAFISGLMTKNDEFSRSDRRTFKKLFNQLGIDAVSWQRMRDCQSRDMAVDLAS